MELRVLGCHGGETAKHRTSSFLLNGKLALDAGAVTSMLTLEEQLRIETVVVSHAHLDHVRDLASLADNRCQQEGAPLVIAGIRETLDDLKRHFFNDRLWPDFSKILTPKGPTIEFREIRWEQPATFSGLSVQAVPVHHTIETAGFVVENAGGGSIAYSGDTGPTDKLWTLLNQRDDLKAVLMEVSFPNEHHKLATVSGHHTPETLKPELAKLHARRDIPILLYHIKPVFEKAVEKELTKIRERELTILKLGDRFTL